MTLVKLCHPRASGGPTNRDLTIFSRDLINLIHSDAPKVNLAALK